MYHVVGKTFVTCNYFEQFGRLRIAAIENSGAGARTEIQHSVAAVRKADDVPYTGQCVCHSGEETIFVSIEIKSDNAQTAAATYIQAVAAIPRY